MCFVDGNLIIYDWLSFTSHHHSVANLIEALGLESVPWEDTKGARGYRDRMYFGSISIHFNGRDDMGVWVEMSGQGCRTFESLSTLADCWKDIFDFIACETLKITRLDVAYDDHIGLLDMNRIVQDTQNGEYISKAEYWETILSSKGSTVQIGSPTSDVLIRIYDKARERNCEAGEHWVRVELQLRNDRAIKFTQLPYSIGESWCGVMINYLRYVDPDPLDSNRWRWPLKDYWGELLYNASAISIYEKPGTDYNLARCANYVINLAGNAVDAYIQICGVDGFLSDLKKRTTRRNPKYDQLVALWKDKAL